MPKKKSSSHALEKARTRSAALSSIDPKLDLGNGLTLKAYADQIDTVQADFDEYNGLLSQVDATKNKFEVDEKQLADLSEQMLIGVAYKFGKDSDEYEKGGGTRKSERKRPAVKKGKTLAAA